MMEARLLKSAICRVNSIKRPYPSLFYFPGLRSSPYWDKKLIPSVKILEDNYQEIKREFMLKRNLLENDYKLIDREHSLHKGKWEWYNYVSKGKIHENFKENFPSTYEILSGIEDRLLNIPFAYCFFSLLDKEGAIAEHYGPCNIRLRIHLGIDIPQDCSISVAGEEKTWEEGKCLVIDDSYLHSVSNNNKEKSRVILLLDIWHPDVHKDERQAIIEMFKGAEQKGWLKN